ncbi:acyltransferase family protein [Vibrio sp. 99-8-1]|uniref:acyltransferase n=1 Tax=Vibrio sp. 99-8-1 TaxID=2607602 RepID=UPI001493D377|nr:acyltransferase family protein [Vibrio sp. 99-8-1]NOI68447.1 acyltransferase family protein [Vibrio sp. 99-8-1]
MKERVFFFDLLRCVAAIAVIAIHVLAPYRHELGVISFDEWFTAISVNSLSRWAVPVFILITGALMLSDRREFNLPYYLKRRLGKVLLPFLVWSLFYAYLSGWTAQGFIAQEVEGALLNSATSATYYHLGFFYYFIPLYFVIPFFQAAVQKQHESWLVLYVGLWLFTTVLYLAKIDGPWSNQMWLYSGYLPLGYLLYQKVPLKRANVVLITLAGLVAGLLTIAMVTSLSLDAGQYTVARWLSYKTINTVVIASMLFMLCRYVANRQLPDKFNKAVCFISQHSLGIYILHPLFLWPVKAFGWDQGHPAWEIPLWVAVSGSLALASSWLLSRSSKTRWLLP